MPRKSCFAFALKTDLQSESVTFEQVECESMAFETDAYGNWHVVGGCVVMGIVFLQFKDWIGFQ